MGCLAFLLLVALVGLAFAWGGAVLTFGVIFCVLYAVAVALKWAVERKAEHSKPKV